LKHFQSVKNKNFSFHQNEKNLVKNQIKEISREFLFKFFGTQRNQQKKLQLQ
jgi:hypothetical protein